MITISDSKNILALGQILLDLLLLFIIFFLYRRLKTLDVRKIEDILDVLKKSEKLSQELEKNLKKNEALTVSLSGALNRKLSDKDLKKEYSPSNKGTSAVYREAPVRPLDSANKKDILHNQVIALWKIGKNLQEIADATGLTQGEVEIIISLAKTKNYPS